MPCSMMACYIRSINLLMEPPMATERERLHNLFPDLDFKPEAVHVGHIIDEVKSAAYR
jgi:hypothetical protein